MRGHTRWMAVLGVALLAACGEGVTQPEAVRCGEGACPASSVAPDPKPQGVKCGEGPCTVSSIAPDPGTVPNPATITGH